MLRETTKRFKALILVLTLLSASVIGTRAESASIHIATPGPGNHLREFASGPADGVEADSTEESMQRKATSVGRRSGRLGDRDGGRPKSSRRQRRYHRRQGHATRRRLWGSARCVHWVEDLPVMPRHEPDSDAHKTSWKVSPGIATSCVASPRARCFAATPELTARFLGCRRVSVGFRMKNMKKSGASQGQSASELISKRIAELGDWRGETLSRMRKLIKEADPDIAEEWKWVKPTKPGTPVWSHDGIICTGESYKNVVKLTFAKGASLKIPSVSSTRVSTETYAARSTSTKEKKLTSPPSRHSFARRSPSTVLASRNLRSDVGCEPQFSCNLRNPQQLASGEVTTQ